jgi:hypothetical protein
MAKTKSKDQGSKDKCLHTVKKDKKSAHKKGRAATIGNAAQEDMDVLKAVSAAHNEPDQPLKRKTKTDVKRKLKKTKVSVEEVR